MQSTVAAVRREEDSNLERGEEKMQSKKRGEIRRGGVENFLASGLHEATRK